MATKKQERKPGALLVNNCVPRGPWTSGVQSAIAQEKMLRSVRELKVIHPNFCDTLKARWEMYTEPDSLTITIQHARELKFQNQIESDKDIRKYRGQYQEMWGLEDDCMVQIINDFDFG